MAYKKKTGNTKNTVTEKISLPKVISGNAFCNIKGLSSRTRFFISKKYKGQFMTQEEWLLLLKRDHAI